MGDVKIEIILHKTGVHPYRSWTSAPKIYVFYFHIIYSFFDIQLVSFAAAWAEVMQCSSSEERCLTSAQAAKETNIQHI